MVRTVDYLITHLPTRKLMDYLADWRKFLNELSRLYGVDWRKVFNTEDVKEVLLGVCRGKTEQECRIEIAKIMLEKAEEIAITRPHEVSKIVRTTVTFRAAMPTPAAERREEAGYRQYVYVHAPPSAEEYMIDELEQLGIDVLQASSPTAYIAMLRLRSWCSQHGKPIVISKEFPTNYAGIRLFYFKNHKPSVCFLEKKEDKIIFYGCDKPVVVIAWNDKCVINVYEPIVE